MGRWDAGGGISTGSLLRARRARTGAPHRWRPAEGDGRVQCGGGEPSPPVYVRPTSPNPSALKGRGESVGALLISPPPPIPMGGGAGGGGSFAKTKRPRRPCRHPSP